MRAIQWLRSRQEQYELIYWLSVVAYDHRDRSLNNRIYLLYLTLFFSVWIFITLAPIAGGGARLLYMLNANDSLSAACLLEVLAVGAWSVFALWGAQRRSPVVFTEQDALLVCQMPINRRHVVLRWFPMPWLKSALPFWVFSIALGFSFAEAISPGGWAANRIFEYAGYGIRTWLVILPIHLALFSLVWATGIYQRQRDIERPWLAGLVTTIALAILAFLLVFMIQPPASAPLVWHALAGLLLFPIQAGFGAGSLSTALLASWLLAAFVFAILYLVSGAFSLSRAAQETRETETINTAFRYGLSAEGHDLMTQNRLGVSQPPTRLPALAGAGVLAWKDALQSQRSFQLAALLDWLSLFGVMLSLPFLPDFGNLAFAIAIWVFQAGKLSVTRLRGDLACWT
ncbi:MAG TPA: hypothetical protein PJ988_10530, partial [Anaerolinea sp.]|nr:hypothetical protein [Anaerolinea sp.]